MALNYIMNKPEEKTILLSIHGRALRILLTWLLNYDLKDMESLFVHQNLSVYQLTHTGTMFTVDVYNSLEHINHS